MIHLHDKTFEPFISSDEIDFAIKNMAKQMDDDFFESSHISIDFFKEKGNQIKDLKFWYYQDDWKAIKLSDNQLVVLLII
jgi:hypothetical protein